MMEENKIISYKGFDKELKCLGFQYEIGKEYETGKADLCSAGFHACENPMDVFRYYNMMDSRFCIVEQSGDTDHGFSDTNTASTRIKVVKEVSMKDLADIIGDWFSGMIPNGEENDLKEKEITVLKGEEQRYANILHGEKIVQYGRLRKLTILGNKVRVKSHSEYSNIALSGNYANIYTDGNSTNIVSNGERVNICSYGNWDSITCSEVKSNICSFGNETYIYAGGTDSNVISVGGGRADITLMGSNIAIASFGSFDRITSHKQLCKIISEGRYADIKSFGFYSTIQSKGQNAKILIGGERTSVKAKNGTEITVVRRNDFCDNKKDKYETFVVGQDDIKEDIWYEFDGEYLVEQ